MLDAHPTPELRKEVRRFARRKGLRAKSETPEFLDKILKMRDEGADVWHIAKEMRISVNRVRHLLLSTSTMELRKRRVFEQMLTLNHRAAELVGQDLDKGSMVTARWLLEMTGAVGKEATNITINATNAQVNLNSDEIEAARAVAAAMRAAMPKSVVELLPASPTQEENSRGIDSNSGNNNVSIPSNPKV